MSSSAAVGSLEMFPALFLGIGVGALAAVPRNAPGDRGFPLAFGLGFAAAGMVPVVLLLAARRRQRAADHLAAVGRLAVGTILGVRDTGSTVNENPVVELSVAVSSHEQPIVAFNGSRTITMPRIRPIRVGERFPVLVDPDDPSRWGIVTAVADTAGAPPGVRELWHLLQDHTPAEPAPVVPPEPEDPAVVWPA